MSLCRKRRSDGEPCRAQAIAGTEACRVHAGRPLVEQRARGNVVVELRSWGLDMDEVRDPGMTLLQLMTQSAMRVELYSGLLRDAYDAAGRLRDAADELANLQPSTLPGVAANTTDYERASGDLQRIFNEGGVAALVGVKWSSSGGEFGGVFAAEEAIRGLVQLEAAERDRCAGMATKAIAAGLAERQVRLAEQQGAMVVDLIRRVLANPLLALSEAQRGAAHEVAAQELRALAAVA